MIYKILSKLGILEKKLPAIMGRALFRQWWSGRRSVAPKDLVLMMDHLLSSGSFSAFSPYWLSLARKNIEQIITRGLDNFKQTVARDYFVVADWKRSYYYENLMKGVDVKKLALESANQRRHQCFGPETSVSYNVFTALLLDHVRKFSHAERYLALVEPAMGNPATIDNDGKPTSSDLLNSIIDYDSIFHSTDESKIQTILEIGGGYGRNAYCNISLLPNLRRYIMVDIPPALFLAQSYISQIFPNKKTFKFRPFSSFKEIEEEFNKSELVFLLPEQIKLLPRKIADLIIAIDCLHEMDKGRVVNYFHEFDRLGKQLYFKCWQKTDKEFFQEGEYPILPAWKEILHRSTIVPARYFEAMYEIP